jgi:phosphotransferase system HPr (HPr) family protein
MWVIKIKSIGVLDITDMETKTVKIKNKNGLHLRVASEVVKICKKHNARVKLVCRGCDEADACSVIDLLLLAAGHGDKLTIKAEGRDAKAVLDEIHNYFSDGGGI